MSVPVDDALGWLRTEYPDARVLEVGIEKIELEPAEPTPRDAIETPDGWEISKEGRAFDGQPTHYLITRT